MRVSARNVKWLACLAVLLLAALPLACGDDDSGHDADADADVEATDEGGADADGDADGDGDGDADGDVEADGDAGPPRRLVILHTNDTHSHFQGTGPELEYSPATTGDDPTVGGAARLATLLAQRRAAATAAGSDVLVTDSGDWLMGTLFEMLDESAAPALSMFAALSYDVITLGNHEFEWGPGHLATTITTARGAGFDIPILATNMITSLTEPGDDAIETLVTGGAILQSTTVTMPDGLVVGVIGWLSEGAASLAPLMDPLTFTEDFAAAEPVAAALKTAGADVVVALTHIGLERWMSPTDSDFAAAAPSVDIIVGGHSHEALTEATIVDGTLIVQAGSNMSYLGELTVDVTDAGVTLVDYELHTLDDSITGDATMQGMVGAWIAALDAGVLTPLLGTTYEAPVVESAFDVTTPGFAESNEGDLITDVFRLTAAALTPTDPVDVAFTSDGVIRDDLLRGDDGVLCVADIFRALPNGIGPDHIPGYPLVSFWASGAELRVACEVAVSLSGLAGSDFFVQMSGQRCHYNPTGTAMIRTDGVYLGNEIAGYSPTSINIDGTDTALYRVAVDLYVAELMSLISTYTYGALTVTPKNADGTTVTDMLTMIVDADPVAAGVQELKLWQALLRYLSMLPDTDADTIPNIPAAYATPLGRYVHD